MMASSPIVDGLKVVHLLYGPATEVLKQLLANQLHRKYFKDNEKTLKPKLKVSEVRKIYPFDNKNDESLLQTLDRDCLETLLQLIGPIPHNDSDDTKTIHDLITVKLLQKHLDKYEGKLKGLNEKKKVLNKAQWANLFPVTRKKWTDSFDITLLCFILFESFDVKPTNMKNRPPADIDTELGDDIDRIRYYRNTVIHGNFLENKDFSFQWESICCVIIRRGGKIYRDKIDDIKYKDLDPYLKQSYEELIKECQLQETIRCKTVEKLEKDIEDAKCDMKATIDTSATQVQKVVKYETQEVKKEVRKSESNIREEITEQASEMKKVMGEQQKEYSSTVNSTLQSYEHKATETMDKAFKKYTDLISEKIKQSQQSGADSDVSISTILSSVQEEIKPVIQKEIKEMTDNVRRSESDSLRIVMNDFHSLVQKMNDYIETNRALDQRIGENVTPRLLQAEKQCEEVAQKLGTFEDTIYQMNRDVQGWVASTNGSILSIKDDIKDMKIYNRGVNNQREEADKKLETFKGTYKEDMRDIFANQKRVNEQLDKMNANYQGLASDMTTASSGIKSMKDAIEDTHTHIGGVGVKCDEVVKKLETFEKTHQQDKRDSSEHDKQMREQLDQMNGDFQGLAREMTTTSTDMKSIKVAMEDTQKEMRGVGKKCEDVTQKLEMFEKAYKMDNHNSSEHDKQMREQLHKMDGKFQGLANGIITCDRHINSTKNAISEMRNNMRRGEPDYEVNKNEMRIVLFGMTARGKSASGNTLLGEKVFSSRSSSTTLTCKLHIAKRFGKTLLVVDTPGVYSDDMPFTQTDEEIRKCIMMASPGPHTFLFVVTTGKFTLEENKMFENYVKLFSEELYKYAIVLFTGKDVREMNDSSTEEYLEHIDPSLRNILEKCGNRYVFFNNCVTQEKRDEYAKELLDMIDPMVHAGFWDQDINQ